jgi:hypothetical protein
MTDLERYRHFLKTMGHDALKWASTVMPNYQAERTEAQAVVDNDLFEGVSKSESTCLATSMWTPILLALMTS